MLLPPGGYRNNVQCKQVFMNLHQTRVAPNVNLVVQSFSYYSGRGQPGKQVF